MSEQAALHLVPPAQNTGGPDLERVQGKLGPVVLAWAKRRWNAHLRKFNLQDLVQYVWSTPEGRYCSPSSPGRTLQALRLAGCLNYEVVNRSQSLYILTPVVPMTGVEELP